MKRSFAIAGLLAVSIPSLLIAAYAEATCPAHIMGVTTGATGSLSGEIEVTATVKTGLFGLGGEKEVTYNVGTYYMSNGKTYKVRCDNLDVLSVT